MEKIIISGDGIKPELFDCLVDLSERIRPMAERFAAIKVKGENTRFAAIRPVKDNDEVNFRVAKAGTGVVDVYLYDVIGFPFIEAQDLLYQIPSDAKTINVHLNTPGGDIFEGVAIYNQLLAHDAQVNVFVDSLAASIGSVIAMAGETITMKPASFIMIHNGWSRIAGDSNDLRAEADLLDKINSQMADIYAKRTGKTRAEMLGYMDKETWFTADEAVEIGMANTKWEGKDDKNAPQALFDLSVFANTPETLRAASIKPIDNKNNHKTEDNQMDPKLKALLMRLGLAKDATDEQALTFLADIDVENIALAEDRQAVVKALDEMTKEPDKKKPGGDKNAFTLEDVASASKAAIQNERVRCAEIRKAVKIAGQPDDMAQKFIDDDTAIDDVRKALFEKMKETNPPVGPGAISMTADGTDKFRNAVSHGLCANLGIKVEKPADGHEQFRAATFENIARLCLERSGVDSRQLISRDQVARAIIRQAAAGTFTTSDFSSIYLDVANKTLLKAYQESPATWRPLVNVVPASDFKTIYGISLSAAPDLDLVGENGEYKSGSMSDNQESYRMYKYGKINYLTYEMIVNDDLRAFARIPQLQGAAARRKESDLVWALITGNPTMNDGVALFHEDHSNIETVSANIGVVNSDNLSSGRKGMRLQTGLQGETLDLMPKFVVVPVAQETDTEIILRSAALPEATMSSGVFNPWGNRLIPIAEPRLDAVSSVAWYMFADPNQIDTIEVAYLNGNEAPYLEQSNLFERDAIGYKVRHVFGCGVMDSRGIWYNPGEEDS